MSASAPSGVLPEDAKLVVTPIVNDGNDSLYEDTSDRLKEQAEKDKQTVDAFIAYDIQFEKDGKEVEPDDGKVTVTMKWDSAVKPEGVQGDEKISVVHLKDEKTVENLSKEKDADKNHASVETDDKDSEALTKAEITSDSFSVYAVEWTIDNVSSITVHYTDENGNEISPADTVDAPADAGADTLAKAIDGYTYASATVDQTNATELKTENGRLSFNDGTNWNQASSKDVYLTYTAVPVEETAAPQESTEAPTETAEPEATSTPEETTEPENPAEGTPAQETTPSSDPSVTEDSEITLNAATKDNKYNVTVTYGKDAGLPDGTKLTVKTISSDNDEYENAKNAVAASRKVDADSLGMTALDITLTDKDGNKVEPKDHSKVKVSINAVGLPSEAESIDIHHIMETNTVSSNPVSNAVNSIVRFSKKVFTGTTDQAEEVKKNVAVTDGQAVADFEVSSFSTFTITWTTTKSTDTGDQKYRIGSITIRYVDENGLNVDTADQLTAEEALKLSQNDGGIIKLSDCANKSDGTSRVTGYTYDHAALDMRDGPAATGVMVKKRVENQSVRTGYEGDYPNGHYTYTNVDVTIYRMYYTTDQEVNADSKWILFNDYGTGTYANNSFVYLIYKKNNIAKPVTIHFLDINGNAIKDSEGNDLTKVIDAADHTTEYDLVEYAKANIPSGYRFSDSNLNSDNAGTNKIIVGDTSGSVTIGNVKGTYDRFMKYEDGLVKFRRGNTSLQAVSDPVNVYITFTGSGTDANDPTEVTIHHVDQYGAKLAADTTDTFGFTNNGASNISAFTNRWNGSSKNSQSGKSYFVQKAVDGIGTYQKAYIGKFNDDNNLGTDGLFFKKTSSTGLWQTGTGSMGTNGASVTKEITVAGQSGLYTDVYDVYSGKKGLTIHYVDENGHDIQPSDGKALSDGDIFNASQDAPEVSGYAFKEAHLGSFGGLLFTTIQYNQDGNNWTSSVKYEDDPVTTEANPVNEVWLEYDKGAVSKKLTVHYQYLSDSGAYSDAYYGIDPKSTTKEITLTSNGRNYLVSDPIDGSFVSNIEDGNVRRAATSGESGPQSLIFMSTHVAALDGPTVTSVDLDSNGNLVYHTSMSGTAEPEDNSSNPTEWMLSQASGAQKGRTVTISKDKDGYLSLNDSLTGDIPLNLVNDEAGSDSDIPETYKGTLQNGTTDVEYIVSVSYFNRTSSGGAVTRIPRYSVEVTNSYPSTSTDIYQVYIDGSKDQDKVWIEDDLKYSGLFRLDVSESLRAKLTAANDSNAVIEWHRITAPDNEKDRIPSVITSNTEMPAGVKDEIVLRKSSGEHWNIALNPNERTWLDIEADEGDDVWAKGTTRAYYAKVTYTPKDATETAVPLYTTPKTISYYGELENGSFEDPSTTSGKNKNYVVPDSNGDYSNAKYKEVGGVWQTTGPGSLRTGEAAHGRNYSGQDIEIVNGTNHNTLKSSYNWQPTSDEESKGDNDSWADDGDQFAELNAENAGALYQDVITHPNEKINYWLSHRARGSTESNRRDVNYHFDTMYVVIMPTKLAMTMGSNGTELRTQSELQDFISKHGGFDDEVIKGPNDSSKEEATLTYYDEDAGIMIYKVRSDEDGWHKVIVNNQYTAKGGLTRFFFAAATTAGDKGRGEVYSQYKIDPPTMGNFIDNVGFSQKLPPTTGFNLTVTETFSGITMEELAGLASNANEYAGTNGIIKQANPLQVTLTNMRRGQGTEVYSNDALNGAKLEFRMSYDNNGGLVLTPTATAQDGSTDLLGTGVSKPGTSNVRQYSDGRIVISWSFPDQLLSEKGNQSTDKTYTYSANDNITDASTTDLAGFDKTTSQNAVNNKTSEINRNNSSAPGEISSSVTTGSDITLNIINVYNPGAHISVRKIFSGVTPTTVNEIMSGTEKNNGQPYSITITNQTNNAVKVLKADGGYQANGTPDNSVSVTSSQNGDGSTTYKWTISDPDWRNGTYSVKEENYLTDRNSLAGIQVNGNPVSLSSDNSWPEQQPSVTVDSNTAANVSFSQTTNGTNGVVDLTENGGVLPDTSIRNSTNLVVAQYTLKPSEGSESKRYIVWAASEAGYITRNAIINQINNIWGENSNDDKATLNNTSFYTGDDAYVVADGRIAKMVHRQSASLTGQTTSDTWDKFYAARMTAKSDGSSVDESEIRINNDYTPKIKIQKQSSDTTADANGNEIHERLNDAVFRLYKKSGSEKLYYQDSGTDQWKNDTEHAKQFKSSKDSESNEDGLAFLDVLPADENNIYYLEEYTAPAGYKKISDISFKVRNNGTVVLVDSDGKETTNDKVQISFIDPYYTFIINDDAGSALPITGGTGTYIFYIAGAILVITAGLLLISKKKAGDPS